MLFSGAARASASRTPGETTSINFQGCTPYDDGANRKVSVSVNQSSSDTCACGSNALAA